MFVVQKPIIAIYHNHFPDSIQSLHESNHQYCTNLYDKAIFFSDVGPAFNVYTVYVSLKEN